MERPLEACVAAACVLTAYARDQGDGRAESATEYICDDLEARLINVVANHRALLMIAVQGR